MDEADAELAPAACVRHEGALCLVMKLYCDSLHELLDARRSPDGSNLVQPPVNWNEPEQLCSGRIYEERMRAVTNLLRTEMRTVSFTIHSRV